MSTRGKKEQDVSLNSFDGMQSRSCEALSHMLKYFPHVHAYVKSEQVFETSRAFYVVEKSNETKLYFQRKSLKQYAIIKREKIR